MPQILKTMSPLVHFFFLLWHFLISDEPEPVQLSLQPVPCFLATYFKYFLPTKLPPFHTDIFRPIYPFWPQCMLLKSCRYPLSGLVHWLLHTRRTEPKVLFHSLKLGVEIERCLLHVWLSLLPGLPLMPTRYFCSASRT